MTQGRTSTLERGLEASATVHAAVSLPEPIQYVVRSTGKPVKAHIFGDVEGMSPAFLCSDEQGAEAWYSIDDLQVADPKYLSASKAQIRQFAQGLQSSSG